MVWKGLEFTQHFRSICYIIKNINNGIRGVRDVPRLTPAISINPIQAGRGGGETAPLDLFVNNFFIVAGIDLKFSVNSQLSFSDHMKFFRDRFGS